MKLALAALCAALAAPSVADAFCGFYIDTQGNEMVNNATQVVMMRQGTRTVLSMQNNYQGPPQDFAMVIPVPVVLKQTDVKTLPKDVFKKVDAMSAPRLVEYWEQDPCYVDEGDEESADADESAPTKSAVRKKSKESEDYGVTVEAKFDVGEYQIVILSAKDSTGLDRYLRDQKYQIPAGAEPLLKPYVAAGSKFFVAKVNPAKVKFVNGMAQLSPLRFHYDHEEFSLPIRLGLVSSSGTQDLVVNILAPNQRYEVANYKNVTIPTNFDVKDEVRTRFGEFYAGLYDRTVQQHPGAVVTEYAWDASTCDPCPGPTLDGNDFMTLGADVMAGKSDEDEDMRPRKRGRRSWGGGYVLTRLHARYGKELTNDLVFKAAPPIAGGREHTIANGQLEHGAQPSDYNNFQGRYAIRHQWTGAITCANPQRGIWGGPPAGAQIAKPQGATDNAFAPRGTMQIPMMIFKDIPEIDVKPGVEIPLSAPTRLASPFPASNQVGKPQGCGCDAGSGGGIAGGFTLVGLVMFALRRRRR
jgi:MYXO-CTERM domain-containing protein